MRKRNIFIGILALEILALPAAAYWHANIEKDERVNVIAAEIKSPTGLKRYFVSSDGPFIVTAKNLTGRNQVKVIARGQIGEAVFGKNAQLPGSARSCTSIDNRQEHIIYNAPKATIMNDGEAVSQAVLFLIAYEPDTFPEIKFIAPKKDLNLLAAKPCLS